MSLRGLQSRPGTFSKTENFLAPSRNWIVKYLGRLSCGLVTVPCELPRRTCSCEASVGVCLTEQRFVFMIRKEQSRISLGVQYCAICYMNIFTGALRCLSFDGLG